MTLTASQEIQALQREIEGIARPALARCRPTGGLRSAVCGNRQRSLNVAASRK